MLVGQTQYYRLSGGKLIRTRNCDPNAPYSKPRLRPDEAAVWTCTNQAGEAERIDAGEGVVRYAAKTGRSLESLIYA